MFAPLAPIRSDSQSAAAVDSVLARIDAIGTVLYGLGHMAGQPSVAPSGSLNQRALLSARLAERDVDAIAHIACELDAIAASLQSGFAALDRARKGGHPALAAAAFLHREASEHLADTLSDPVLSNHHA